MMLYPATELEKAGFKVRVTDFLVDDVGT